MIRPMGGTALVAGVAAVVLAVAGLWIWRHFEDDIQRARELQAKLASLTD